MCKMLTERFQFHAKYESVLILDEKISFLFSLIFWQIAISTIVYIHLIAFILFWASALHYSIRNYIETHSMQSTNE